jgi:hypothetical protein
MDASTDATMIRRFGYIFEGAKRLSGESARAGDPAAWRALAG